MTLADKVYQAVKPLPEPLVQEVLDFAFFLQRREESTAWKNLMQAQASSLADWDNAEDELWNHDTQEPSDLLINIAQGLPTIAAFSARDPLSLQQEMRDEWR